MAAFAYVNLNRFGTSTNPTNLTQFKKYWKIYPISRDYFISNANFCKGIDDEMAPSVLRR